MQPEPPRSVRALCCACGFVLACSPSAAPLGEAERAAVAQAVDSATVAFLTAERALDAEGVIAHLAPEFYIYVDGVRTAYASVSAQIRATFPSLRQFDATLDDREITVLGRDGAVVSAVFRDAMTDTAGTTMRLWGATTLVWQRRGADWVLVYADADHYPDTASGG